MAMVGLNFASMNLAKTYLFELMCWLWAAAIHSPFIVDPPLLLPEIYAFKLLLTSDFVTYFFLFELQRIVLEFSSHVNFCYSI